MRERLDRQKVEMLAANAVEMFPAETAQSMLDFRAQRTQIIRGQHPTPEAWAKFTAMLERKGPRSSGAHRQVVDGPARRHRSDPGGVDHFLFNENSARVWNVLRGWLDTYFPARV